MEEKTTGTLAEGEYHPAASYALSWIKNLPVKELFLWKETFASTALAGNRVAEICSETLDRVMDGGTVSDRYVLGLAWMMKYGEKNDS